MKELMKIFLKDIQEEKFTKNEKIVYGIIAPLAFVAFIWLSGWIETLI